MEIRCLILIYLFHPSRLVWTDTFQCGEISMVILNEKTHDKPWRFLEKKLKSESKLKGR